LRLWGATVLLAVLALGGWFGWRYLRAELERREAFELAEQASFDQARPLLLRIYERHPEDVAVVRALALGYRGEPRQIAEAERFLDLWCKLRPDAPEPFRERFEFRAKHQQVAQAVADADTVLHLDPADYSLRKRLAQLLLLNGDFEHAEKHALRCYEARRDDVEVWLLLARVSHGLHRDSQATALADQVLRKQPDFPDALKLRADLYLQAGQADAAVGLLRKAAAAPGTKGYRWLYDLSLALQRAGRADEAAAVLREAQWRRALAHWAADEDRDDNPPLQEGVVQAYLADGKIDDAIGFLSDILQRNPRAAPGTHLLLAACYDKQGKRERAAEQRRLADSKP
jgi:predicted Zn-dependent protease